MYPFFLHPQPDNLKQVIAHGLQCVVKNKHSAAEIIFTQALFLPDFQRIELKAFVYICLAVVAYRRHKAGYVSLLPGNCIRIKCMYVYTMLAICNGWTVNHWVGGGIFS